MEGFSFVQLQRPSPPKFSLSAFWEQLHTQDQRLVPLQLSQAFEV